MVSYDLSGKSVYQYLTEDIMAMAMHAAHCEEHGARDSASEWLAHRERKIAHRDNLPIEKWSAPAILYPELIRS